MLFDRRLPEFPFNWHYHPEYELTLTLGSRGMRFVGDSIAAYDDGDLVLIAPNLPHAFQSHALVGEARQHRAVVCWFTQGWIDGVLGAIPEIGPLGGLLTEACRGVQFGAAVTETVRDHIDQLWQMDELRQVLTLQSVLMTLAGAADRAPLASGAVTVSTFPRDRERMQQVLDYLHRTYDQPLRLAPICDLIHLTESQLQRVFKRSARMSISTYVMQLRVGQACQMLVHSDLAIGHIANESGFSDAADFARRFRKARGLTPSAYRAAYRDGMSGDALRPRSLST